MATGMDCAGDRNFIIHYFPGHSVTVGVHVAVGKPVKFQELMKHVGVALKLSQGSLKIFGLFMGSLGSPQKLCAGNEIIPAGTINLSFQRLSFDEEVEKIIIAEDDGAMELIYWESKNQFESNLIVPKLKLEQIEYFDKMIALIIKGTLSPRRFVQAMGNLPFYFWSYYYRANDCTLMNNITAGAVSLERGKLVHIVMNLEKLILLDASDEQKLASWSWHCLRCVKMQMTPIDLIKFEVLITDVDEIVPLRLISLETKHNTYMFSIALHLLKIQESQYLCKHHLLPFNPSIAVAELVTRHRVYQHINKCFHDSVSEPQEEEAEAQEPEKEQVPEEEKPEQEREEQEKTEAPGKKKGAAYN